MTTTTATIVFTDLVGSTALRVALGEERADELRRAHDQLLGAQVSAGGGRVVKGGGDGLLAAFDSASAALSGAVEMQRAVAAYNRRPDRLAELSVRIGLSAGDVSWEDGDCFGTPVVEAARLEAAADGGQILCSEFVRMMARGRGGHELELLGELSLKGLPEPVAAYRVRWEDQPIGQRPLPATLAADASGPFVGRARELAEVLATIDESNAAHCSAVWLLGEPGIGKTTLAAQAAGNRHGAGWTVTLGRCDDGLQSPYQPIAQIVRQIASAWPTRVSELSLGTRLGLGKLCPDLIDELHVGLPASEVDQEHVFEAVARLFVEVSEKDRTLIVLDDLHWATDTTLLLVSHVLRSVPAGRLAVIATVRDTECPTLLRALIDETVIRGSAVALTVGGLSAGAVTELAELAGLKGVGEAGGAKLHGQTAGNPFFVRALLAGGGPRSESADAAVRRRVLKLSESSRMLLLTAAVAGLEFDLRVVTAAVGAAEIDVLAAVEEAAAAALVSEVGPHRFRFAHALVRDNLEGQLSATRRVLAHRSLADAYDAVAPSLVNRIAFHRSECVVDAETRRVAVTQLMEAGHIAAAAFDHDEAIRAFARARELSDPADAATYARVLAALGGAQLSSGSRGEATAAILTEALELSTHLGLADVWADAQLRLYMLQVSNTVPVTPHRPPDVAVGVHDADPVLVLRANAARAAWMYGNGVAGIRTEWLRELLSEAQRLGDGYSIAWVANTLSAVLPRYQAVERAEMGRVAIRSWSAGGEGMLLTMARGRLVGDLLALGQRVEAEAEIDQMRQTGLVRRDLWLQQYTEVARSTLALVDGDFSAAEQAAFAAVALAEQVDGLDLSGLHGMQMFSIRREQGRMGEVAGALRVLARLNPDDAGAWRPGLAAAYAELGMASEAHGELARVVVGPVVDLPDDERLPFSASYLADAAAVVGDRAIAATLLAVLKPHAELNVSLLNIACYGPMKRYLGMLAFTLGDHPAARRYLIDATEGCRRLRSPTFEAHCCYWLARVEAATGTAAEFAEHHQHGERLARHLGMASLAERFARLPLEAS